MRRALRFKTATTRREREQVHRLNYATFVEEIPQHEPNAERRRVDRFDEENTYLIALRGKELVGMVAVRAKRPFSLDQKLPDLDRRLPPHRSVCEIRLLSIERPHRGGPLMWGMVKMLDEYCRRNGHDLAIISGTTRQLKLYGHLGFVPFGPLVGNEGARFQPMYLTRDNYERATRLLKRSRRRDVR